MNRRDFLQAAGLGSTGLALAQTAPASGWRTFEVTTQVDVLKSSGATRVWLPVGVTRETPFQRSLSNVFHAEGGTARLVETSADSLGIVTAAFPAGVAPRVTLVSRVATRDYAVDLSSPGHAPKPDPAELEHFLRATKLLPTGGIVKVTAAFITRRSRTDLEKARAIYDWIVDNTFRDPKTRGCGLGNILFMLESHDLGGKCADINSLFVGLARAAGLPARDVYGIRVAKSKLGYTSLGASSANITGAQHCRAEVYLGDYGWVPVDPADVRKVALEEPPGNRPMNDDMVKRARTRLFGSWEMNWLAYNFAHDVVLPGSTRPPVGFLMYPHAETAAGRLDTLDAANFRYTITAKET